VSIEWREKAHTGTGLRVAVGPDGKLASGGKTLMLPLGDWVQVEMTCGLGKQSTGTYGLIVTLPGAKPRRFAKLPLESKGFRKFGWLVITSGATAKTAFYIDDLEIRYTPAK
jgi:hypothetical protein